MKDKEKEHFYVVDKNNDNLMGSQIDKDKDRDWSSVYDKRKKRPIETTTVGGNYNNKKGRVQRSQI